jgi:RNA polymerase sigma-70 factor (ECF subfamily)
LNTGSELKENNPDTILAAKELQKGIDALDKDFRRAFDMYNEGYKYKEIADDLNLTIGTVKSRIFYSRKKLMESLKEYQPV